MELLQPILIVGGLVAWFITKNKRWTILCLIGLVWIILDVAPLIKAGM